MPVRLLTRFAILMLALILCAPCAKAESAMNLLLIGVDAAGADKTGRSDTMILARADPQRGEVRMVSFLRDLYVQVDGAGHTRLNAAYAHGGEELLKSTLEQLFGVEIHRTITVDFELLKQLVDDLGGIDVEITEKERQALNALLKDHGADCTLSQAGLQRLNGIQTLCYSRIRKLDSDFQRTSRQQAVITAMLHSAAEMDVWQQLRLALRYLPQLTTDMTLGDITALLPMLADAGSLRFHTAQVPFEGAYSDEVIHGMMVLAPDLPLNRTKLTMFLNSEE